MSPQSLTTAAVASGVLLIATGGLSGKSDPSLSAASRPAAASASNITERGAGRLAAIPAPSGSVMISLFSLALLVRRRSECPVTRLPR